MVNAMTHLECLDRNNPEVIALALDNLDASWDKLALQVCLDNCSFCEMGVEDSDVAEITKSQVDLCQGQDSKDRDFGYVEGDEGGYFFTWMPTLEATLDSIEEDEQDGDGDLDESEVRDFLESYLPTTKRGVRLWGEAE